MKHFILLCLIFAISCENIAPYGTTDCDTKISTPLFENHGQTPLSQMEEQANIFDNVFTRICSEDSTVYLTFDDGPSKYTPKILDILETYNVPATFFVVGTNIDKYRGCLKRMVYLEHSIGNHTYTHAHLNKDNFVDEIADSEKLIREFVPNYQHIFRAPWGDISNDQWKFISQNNEIKMYHWSLNTEDWWWNKHGSADDIVNTVVRYVKPGDIILMHDGGGNRTETVKALPRIIKFLKTHGYNLKSLK